MNRGYLEMINVRMATIEDIPAIAEVGLKSFGFGSQYQRLQVL